MRFAVILAALVLSACAATQQQKLANDRCHGHWKVATSQVNGKTVYTAVCDTSK